MKHEPLTTADLARADQTAPAPTPPRDQMPDRAPAQDHPSRVGEPAATDDAPLFAHELAAELRRRWDDVQTGFVDEPRRAVEQADGLVAETMKRLAETFAVQRQTLEGQWDRGDQVSTEDLRQVLRRYRTFFHRLLSI